MKTFDEAMGLLCTEKEDYTPEETRRQGEALLAELEKRTGLAREVSANPKSLMFIQGLVVSCIPDMDPLELMRLTPVLLSIFINGVLVGAEMERQELPMPRYPEEE